MTFGELCDSLLREHDVDESRLEDDMRTFFRGLEQGLVRLHDRVRLEGGALGAGDARLIDARPYTRASGSRCDKTGSERVYPGEDRLWSLSVRRAPPTWAVGVASHAVPRATCSTQSLALQWLCSTRI
jgi:hypothetical protein